LRELVTNAADPVIWSSAWSPCRLASVTKQAIWRRAEAIDGWFGREEGETVMDLVASAAQVAGGYLRIVEIGSYHGRSTAVLGGTLLEAGIPGRVYAVDPHNGHVGASDGALGEERREPTLATFTNNLGWAIASDRLTIVRQRSETVDWRLPVDVLLLDGLHDYTSVRADLGRFAPHVRVGGLIIFHDRSVDFPAVEVWINRLLESRCYRMCAEIGSLVALQKISRASDPNPDLKALDPLAEASAINAVQAKALGTLRERVDSLTRERLALSTELIRTQSRVTDLLKSRTWRWTTPFRAIWARLRRL
jgi:predicted O-methyltransferase YrrM